MRILITGGSGLIGRALTARLCDEDHEVIILSRSPEKVNDLPKGARAVAWDAKTAQGWGQLADGAGAIINLAGASIAGQGLIPSRWTAERKRRILQSRLDAGQAVVAAVEAAQRKPSVVVQASAIGYYGPHQDEPVDENTPVGDDFLARVCVDWENSTQPVEAMGVRRVVTRSGLVLTRQGGIFPVFLLQFNLFSGGPIGNGRQYYSWIHFDDLLSAYQFLIENPEARGVFNLTAPNPKTSSEFGRTLGKVMGRPYWFPVPAFGMKLALGEVAMLALEGQRVLPRHLEALDFKFRYPKLEPALRQMLDK